MCRPQRHYTIDVGLGYQHRAVASKAKEAGLAYRALAISIVTPTLHSNGGCPEDRGEQEHQGEAERDRSQPEDEQELLVSVHACGL
jgi:hypothetical protein